VELGEVEAVLARLTGVRACAVELREDDGRAQLVAYVAGARAASDPFAGCTTHHLPDGRRVAHRNHNETDYLYQELFAKRSYLRHGVALREGAVVFDVGANIGLFTLLALDECPTARVYAFEPLEEVCQALRANARAHGGGRVKVFAHGLSERERVEEFSYYPRYTMMSGQSTYADPASEVGVIERYLKNELAQGRGEAAELLAHSEQLLEGRFEERRERCQLRRLADVMREEGVEWIDLLKVDVQRAELDVLRGLEAEDWSKVGQVVMEVHDKRGEASEGRVREARELLEARGFRVAAEQDELLRGTDRWNLYAVREGYEAARDAAAEKELARERAAAGVLRERRAEDEAAGLTEWELRASCARELPEYMRPSAYVLLNSLPLTRNGKVDRKALPALEEVRALSVRDYAAPQSELEQEVANVWRRLLRVEKVCVHENFFDAGGHSLLMVQFYRALREVVEVEFTLLDLFKHPTISLLAKRLGEGQAERKGVEKIHERVSKREEALMRHRQLMTERKVVNG
jgi:FkbM family methyltransferase